MSTCPFRAVGAGLLLQKSESVRVKTSRFVRARCAFSAQIRNVHFVNKLRSLCHAMTYDDKRECRHSKDSGRVFGRTNCDRSPTSLQTILSGAVASECAALA